MQRLALYVYGLMKVNHDRRGLTRRKLRASSCSSFFAAIEPELQVNLAGAEICALSPFIVSAEIDDEQYADAEL